MIEGWYYLHENGELIYKRELGGTAADIRESDFARALWPVDPRDRAGAWDILVESLAAGANEDRVAELAAKWKCGNEDARIYAEHRGVTISPEGDEWSASGKGKCGVGATALEAMADLCKVLGYRPAKMWGMTFRSLLEGAR